MPLTGSRVGLCATWGPWQMARAKEPPTVVKHLKWTQKFNSSFKLFLFVTDALLRSCCWFLQHVLSPLWGSGMWGDSQLHSLASAASCHLLMRKTLPADIPCPSLFSTIGGGMISASPSSLEEKSLVFQHLPCLHHEILPFSASLRKFQALTRARPNSRHLGIHQWIRLWIISDCE